MNEKFKVIPAMQNEVLFVHDSLIAFNKSQATFIQEQDPIPKNYIIKDNGKIIAGINALIYHWRILYIDVLFVDKDHRRKDFGSILLKKVEDEARAVGVELAHLDNFDFQAKDFYLKHGYEIFGVLENCPKGHNRYYLKKNLVLST